MLKRALAAVALLVLAAMTFHGVAHAAVLDGDACAACAVGAARVSAPAVPRVVRVETPAVAVEAPRLPAERPSLKPRPVARPPPRG